jgi:hypothetical protein
MNFGTALEAVKSGSRIARDGWNGKNMYVFLNKGAMPNFVKSVFYGPVRSNLFDMGAGGELVVMPSLAMKTADGSLVVGWLASQTDMLAEDWDVLP